MKLALLPLLAIASVSLSFAAHAQVVIAHRGASGYVPEHTLAATAMAHQMGVEFVEQDVVLTKDSETIVLHDIYLDAVTDVADLYPDRARDDGRYYAIDFTRAEIRELRVCERISDKSLRALFPRAAFPKRFPTGHYMFPVPTLAEELELIQGLNKSTGRDVGVYVEIKSPKWHRDQGRDISLIVLEQLGRFGYVDKDDNAFVQCFDSAETRRMRDELKTKLPLIQLLHDQEWRDANEPAEERLRDIAKYAQGIGPSISLILDGRQDGRPRISRLTDDAHAAGLLVHPYTARKDQLLDSVNSYRELIQALFVDAKVDGLFTDHPDVTIGERELLKFDSVKQN